MLACWHISRVCFSDDPLFSPCQSNLIRTTFAFTWQYIHRHIHIPCNNTIHIYHQSLFSILQFCNLPNLQSITLVAQVPRLEKKKNRQHRQKKLKFISIHFQHNLSFFFPPNIYIPHLNLLKPLASERQKSQEKYKGWSHPIYVWFYSYYASLISAFQYQ